MFPITADFILVDASSWLRTWTGVVSYKTHAVAATSCLSWRLRRWGGSEDAGPLRGFYWPGGQP